MKAWNTYWFAPSSSCLDLADVRIFASIGTLFFAWHHRDYFSVIRSLAELPDSHYRPLMLFRILNTPFGWGVDTAGTYLGRPTGEFVAAVFMVCIVAGILSTIGLLTRISLAVFAITFCYVAAYTYAFGDFHHPASAMVVALAALALSPANRVLSADAMLRRDGRRIDAVGVTDQFAGWPIKMIMWFFVLMYWSAVYSKLHTSGLDWANGYTLQWYLARAAITQESGLPLWLSQQHLLVMLTQIGVLAFQTTFFLCILFPRLRWLYVPAGLVLHVAIYFTLHAPFFTWIALYSIFVPWAELVRRLRGSTYPVVAPTGAGHLE